MVKSHSLGIRLPPEVKDALEGAARADVRSMSSMAEKILTDWLQQNGHLPRTKPGIIEYYEQLATENPDND